MRRLLLLIICAAALLAGRSLSAGGTVALFGGANIQHCVGYPLGATVCGAPTGTPGALNTTTAQDQIRVRKWTATEPGRITGVWVRHGTNVSATAFSVVYYNGTELRGAATYTPIAGAWQFVPMVAFSGRSLAFAAGATIYYGLEVDDVTNIDIMRDTSVTGGSYVYAADPGLYRSDPLGSVTESTTSDMAVKLTYEQ